MNPKYDLAITQTHISTLQNVIARMSNYSLNSKTWAVTLLTGLIVILMDQSKICYYWISFIPITLFFLLDCYYLGLEKAFRDIYNEFLSDLSSDKEIDAILKFSLKGRRFQNFLKSFISFSTTPYYVALYATVLTIKCVFTK